MAEIRTLGGLLATFLTPGTMHTLSKLLDCPMSELEKLTDPEQELWVLGDKLIPILLELDLDLNQVSFFTGTPIRFRRAKFTERLKRTRERKHLTAEALSHKAEINYNTYTQYESGRRTPSYPAMVKIAKALDVDVNYFSECEFGDQRDEEQEAAPKPKFSGGSRRYPPPPSEEEQESRSAGTDDDPIPF